MTISGSRTIRVHAQTTADGRGMLAFAHDLDKAAAEIDRLDASTEKAAWHMRGADRDMQAWNRTLTDARRKVSDLHLAVARAGDETSRGRLFGDLRGAERDLRKLERTALAVAAMRPGRGGGGAGGVLASLLPGDSSGKSGGWGGTGIDFSRGLSEFRGTAIMGLIGLAVAASPAIGAAVAGAVTGVVGGGGIIGGVVAAASDARVKDAWSQFTASFSADDFGRQAFVRPTIAALDEIKSAFRDMDFGSALEQVAPFVDVLAKGIGDLGRQFMPGFNDALSKAGPFLEVLSKELGDTGAALGDMFSSMASSHGAIEGLATLFDLLEGTIRFLGAASETLADTWDGLTNAGEWLGDKTEKVAHVMEKALGPLGFLWHGLADRVENATDHFREWNDVADQSIDAADQARRRYDDLRYASDSLAMSIAGQRDKLSALNAAYEDFYNIQMGVDEANQQVNRAWLRLRESLHDNGKHWETSTQQGLDNRDAVLGVVSALNQQRDKALAAAGDSVAAQQSVNRAYEQGIKDLETLAAKNGLLGASLQDLVKEYELKFTLKVSIDAASAGLLALAARLTSSALGLGVGFGTGGGTAAKPAKQQPWQQTGSQWSPWPGMYPGFAAGGWAPANTPVVIGEHSPMGPQMTMFRRPTYIMPGPGSGSSSGANVTVSFPATGDRLLDAILRELKKYVQVSTGGDAQKALGRTKR